MMLHRGSAAVCVVSLGSGVLASWAFDPVAIGWLLPLGTASWLLASASLGSRGAAVSGFVFGLGFFVPLLAWLGPSIGTGAWLALSVAQALWFVAAGVAVHAIRQVPFRPLGASAVLTLVEVLRSSWPFGGLPWGRAGIAALDTAWSGLLPWIGLTGTTFVLMVVAAAGAEVVRLPTLKTWMGLAVIATGSLLPVAIPVSVATDRSLTVAVVQGGVPGDGRSVARYNREITQSHRDATVELARRAEVGTVPRPELVVWPESAVSVDPVRDGVARRAAMAATRAAGAPLLAGGIADTQDPDQALNQTVLWDPEDGPVARYTKQHLVPFGEYVPFRSMLGGLSDRFREIPRDMLPGPVAPPLDIFGDGTVTVAMAICFDIAFDDVILSQTRDGADLAVVQTSNAAFTGTSQLDQQLTITRARALESGRAVVVASVNGLTAVVGPDGDVVDQAPRLTTQVLVQSVPLASDLTPATRVGSSTTAVVAVLVASYLGVAAWRRRRQGT
jgi:apolipoprotein N-acyltransferase